MLDLSRASKDSPIVMKCEKQRDTAPFDDLRLDLKVIPLYVDPNTLKTITSCVVIPSDAPIKPGLSDTQQVALDLLEDGMTFAEWHKAVNAECSVVKRTLERWRDDFIHKGLINKIEMQGKHPTYTRSSGISSSSEVDYE